MREDGKDENGKCSNIPRDGAPAFLCHDWDRAVGVSDTTDV